MYQKGASYFSMKVAKLLEVSYFPPGVENSPAEEIHKENCDSTIKKWKLKIKVLKYVFNLTLFKMYTSIMLDSSSNARSIRFLISNNLLKK